jgi:Rad3-related DNA helicase
MDRTGEIVIPFKSNKFKSGFRNNQKNIVSEVIKSNKKVIVLNAPTGTGKSIIGFCAGHYKNSINQTLYVCSGKMLQEQLHNDFPEAMLLKGRSNYTCNLNPNYTAEDCDEKCSEYELGEMDCAYESAKSFAMSSKYTILNTSYYLTEINYIGRFSNRNTVIIDEADGLEDSLVDFISLEVHPKAIQKYNLGQPEYVTKLDSWKTWTDQAISKLSRYTNYHGTEDEVKKERLRVKRLLAKAELLRNNINESWLFDHKDKFTFRPLWLTRELVDNYFLNHANQFILMSATMPPKAIVSKLFGLNTSEIDYIETDCPFPIANRQVIYNPIKRLKYGEDEQDIYREIERIIKVHKYQKGIIHAVSYDRMNKIAAIDPSRMITHNSFNKSDQLKKFYESTNGIFVSPSSERGLDLVGDLGRFAIWPKVPFPSLADKVVSRRLYTKPFGDYWYKAMTAQSIIQGCGRIVRNETDHGTNYILDSAFDSIIEFAPKYFRDAIVCKF